MQQSRSPDNVYPPPPVAQLPFRAGRMPMTGERGTGIVLAIVIDPVYGESARPGNSRADALGLMMKLPLAPAVALALLDFVEGKAAARQR